MECEMARSVYAVIGCGRRARSLLPHLMEAAGPELELKGGFDPVPENVAATLEAGDSQAGVCYDSLAQLLADPAIDWVFVASPNYLHCEHVLAALQAGKHVFVEKPLATSVDECLAMARAGKSSGKLVATGFVLRYSALYRKAKELLDAGTIGRIVSIDANENITPAHGAHIMTNWRRYAEKSGGHIVEKCCHDLDLLNWYTGSRPVRVAAFAGNDMFIPENQGLRKLGNGKLFDGWYNGEDPFLSDNTIRDNIVAILEYENGMRAQFQATMSNAIPERRIYFHGTEGNIVVEIYSSTLKYRRVDSDVLHSLRIASHDLHAGGDRHIMAALAESILHGVEPECSILEGMLSTVAAICIREAYTGNRIVDLAPIWDRFAQGC
jgi:predicted dehydrogenase